MMNIINIHNLSQENVSCLNTTLIVLMLANRRNILPKYLRAIKSKSVEMLLASDLVHVNTRLANSLSGSTSGVSSSTTITGHHHQPVDLMTNFRDLLIFWQSHYLQKDKDCAGLEQNSRIDFSYWKKTVEMLLDRNVKNECSLSYYLDNENYYLTNKTRIDEYRSD
jgi:Trpc4-associated protein